MRNIYAIPEDSRVWGMMIYAYSQQEFLKKNEKLKKMNVTDEELYSLVLSLLRKDRLYIKALDDEKATIEPVLGKKENEITNIDFDSLIGRYKEMKRLYEDYKFWEEQEKLGKED